MSKSQRTKGQSGERELANILSDYLGTKVQRNLGQERDGGCDVTVGEWAIQVKRQEKMRPYPWLAQATQDADTNYRPVVAARSNGKRWIVMMDIADFMDIVREGM